MSIVRTTLDINLEYSERMFCILFDSTESTQIVLLISFQSDKINLNNVAGNSAILDVEWKVSSQKHQFCGQGVVEGNRGETLACHHEQINSLCLFSSFVLNKSVIT